MQQSTTANTMLPPNSGPDIDGVKALDAAIAKARPSFVDLTKTANNPHFKSSYAPLEDVLAAVTPALAKEKVSISTAGVLAGERFYFCTTLTHADGGWRCSYFPVTDPAPQKVGGTETYAQRYNICGLLGITAGADDDGNAASGIKSTKRGSSNGKTATAAASFNDGW